MRYRVLPYRAGSRSATALATALGGRVLRLEGSTFNARRDDVIINWGNNNPPRDCNRNGNAALLRTATDKLLFFQALAGTDITPRFWTVREDIPDDAFPVVARTVLRGHSGAGIVICPDRNSLVPARLYVQYVKKQAEYRIHCGRQGDTSVTIFAQRKVRREGVEITDWHVRNHAAGFIYQRNGINPPAEVFRRAHEAFSRLGLDFGAVDVIYNERQQRAYVLEINSAPGLEGQSVQDYANYFRGV